MVPHIFQLKPKRSIIGQKQIPKRLTRSNCSFTHVLNSFFHACFTLGSYNKNASGVTIIDNSEGVIKIGTVNDYGILGECLFEEYGIDTEVIENNDNNTNDNKVALKYYTEASYLLPMLMNNTVSFGLLPEPAVSKLLKLNPDFNIELDIYRKIGLVNKWIYVRIYFS